ncbi:NAD-dependent epimerase/dehydratase family protein [Microbacterium sp. RD1]|uniref:NAD-dependent epimerase/dehydratase family protein n=1 Tax=Microbacterium sp. RD1 TaxID=3457313 RepID=UPI003FA58418
MPETVLVVGASGLIGTAVVEEYAEAGWDVVALARRAPETTTAAPYRHLAVDLLDAAALRRAMGALPWIERVVYAAAFEKPGLVAGWSDREQMQTNLRMLQNVLDALRAAPAHVVIMQGTKAYGVHLHSIPLPARERHPRDPHENFYWLQEDHLGRWASETGAAWTILRPVQVVGPVYGVAYSTPPVIGAYAAIARETGLPFAFPGGRFAPVQAADVALVARAIRWAAETPAAWGEHFNLTNGEVFSWAELWPAFADVFGIEAAPPIRLRLAEFLPEHERTWERIVARHGLRPLSLAEVIGKSHQYADYTFGVDIDGPAVPALVSTVKVKAAGFCEVRDTEYMFRDALHALIARGVLPR